MEGCRHACHLIMALPPVCRCQGSSMVQGVGWVGLGCGGPSTLLMPLLLPRHFAHALLLPRRPRRLANHNRVGGAIKAGAQLIDSTATQVSLQCRCRTVKPKHPEGPCSAVDCCGAAAAAAAPAAALVLLRIGVAACLAVEVCSLRPTPAPTLSCRSFVHMLRPPLLSPSGCCVSSLAHLSPGLAAPPQIVHVLRQYPAGRLVVFAYILGVHLFIYILLHRWGRLLLCGGSVGCCYVGALFIRHGVGRGCSVAYLLGAPAHLRLAAHVDSGAGLEARGAAVGEEAARNITATQTFRCCRLQHKAFHAEMAVEALHRDERI